LLGVGAHTGEQSRGKAQAGRSASEILRDLIVFFHGLYWVVTAKADGQTHYARSHDFDGHGFGTVQEPNSMIYETKLLKHDSMEAD
jgi:hypothetical protein